MKITKLSHSCLLVEMPEPVNRTALFDPGVYSEKWIDINSLVYLDDIIITHEHADHLSIPLLQQLLEKFPEVRITAPPAVVMQLKQQSIFSTSEPYEGIVQFESPHEQEGLLFNTPEQSGYHYLDRLSHPGDSHSFTETCPLLALPVTAPWGATVLAIDLALRLRPTHIVPIHDWHWRDEARAHIYERLQELFEGQGIVFIPAEDGRPFVVHQDGSVEHK